MSCSFFLIQLELRRLAFAEHPPNEDEQPEDASIFDRRYLRGQATQQQRSVQQEGPSIIDVLVVYTQGAEDDDSTFGIENRINLAITETNQAYFNSGIKAELHLALAHKDHSGYDADVGSTSMRPSLDHLTHTGGSNSDLDYVHKLRDDVGADMVALITTGAGCGIAWLSGNCVGCDPFAEDAFSVTKYSCATG